MAPKPTEMPGATAVLDAHIDSALDVAEVVGGAGDEGEAAPEMFRTFTDQAVAPIGVPTSDGRLFSSDIELSFRTCPLPLQWCEQSTSGHDMSYTVGVIESIRREGDEVLASGYMLNTSHAEDACTLIASGVSNPSVDLANADWMYTDKDGNELEWEDLWDLMDEGGEYFMTFTKAEVIATTLVSTPAFDTRFTLDAERSTREPAVVASAVVEFKPKVYPAGMFEDPKLTAPTLPTYGDDGRVYGHLAQWGECHRGIQDYCQLVPKNLSGYRQFHTSPSVRLDDGSRLPVGRLTVGTGHAPGGMAGAPAMAHYDNTGTCFALVRVGEDAHGIWFSGVVAPGADAAMVEQGLSAPLSGDWRDFGQGLELVAALAVNTPGFNVRPHGRTDEDDRTVALVASGRLSPRTKRGGMSLSRADIKAIMREALREEAQAQAVEERKLTAIEKARKAAAGIIPAKDVKLASAVDRARAVVGK